MVTELRVQNKRWDWDYFLKVRQEVLSEWPTGRELLDPGALDDAVAYQAAQPWWKFAALRNAQAEKEDRTQICPQVGHALVEQVVDQTRHCEDLKPDRWIVITDTYTRKSQFARAQEAVERSRGGEYSYLNGYPSAAHGVAGARAINESTPAGLGTDNCDEDARLTWEILLAGGWTFGTNQALNQVIQHSRDYPLEQMIFNHQYMDCLAAYYTERGAPILRRASANLPGWDSLGAKVVVSLIECLMSAEQGTKHIDLSLGLGMNLIQDVAAIHTLKKLAQEYLHRFGYDDVKVYSWIYFFLGDWPRDQAALTSQLSWNAAVTTLAGCSGMIVKSLDEASSTPTKEGFRAGIKIARQTGRLMSGQRLPEGPDLRLEKDMMELEARAVIEKVMELGEGDLAVGACRAVEAGVLDTLFSPWRRLKGKVLVVRDRQGALRYLDPGDVPLPPEVREYHRAKIAQREDLEGTTADLKWVIREATWTSRLLEEEAAERPY